MAKVLVAFSGGVESTAVLHHMVQTHGASNVRALYVCKREDENNIVGIDKLYRAEKLYTKLIAQHYGVTLTTVERDFVDGTSSIPRYSPHLWSQEALALCLIDRDFTELASGLHAGEQPAGHALLIQDYFLKVMEHEGLNVQRTRPLSHLTKKQQWDMLPEQVKTMVWYCVNYQSRQVINGQTTSFTRCGTCAKCQEFDTLVGTM